MMKNSESQNGKRKKAGFIKTEGPFDTQSEANRLMVNKFLKRSSQWGKPTEVNNHFYFSTEVNASSAAEDLREIGFSVEEPAHTESDSGAPWKLLCRIEMVLDEKNINRLGEFLESVAEKYNGNYDGWEIIVEDDDPDMFQDLDKEEDET